MINFSGSELYLWYGKAFSPGMFDGIVFLKSKSKKEFPVFLSKIYVFPVLVDIIIVSKYLLLIFKSEIIGGDDMSKSHKSWNTS